jgi:hypothetical protein
VVEKRGRRVGGQFGSPFCTSLIRQARSLNGETALVLVQVPVQVRAAHFHYSSSGQNLEKKFEMPS